MIPIKQTLLSFQTSQWWYAKLSIYCSHSRNVSPSHAECSKIVYLLSSTKRVCCMYAYNWIDTEWISRTFRLWIVLSFRVPFINLIQAYRSCPINFEPTCVTRHSTIWQTHMVPTYSCRVVQNESKKLRTGSLCWIACEIWLILLESSGQPLVSQLPVSFDDCGGNAGDQYTYNGIVQHQKEHHTMNSVVFTCW